MLYNIFNRYKFTTYDMITQCDVTVKPV